MPLAAALCLAVAVFGLIAAGRRGGRAEERLGRLSGAVVPGRSPAGDETRSGGRAEIWLNLARRLAPAGLAAWLERLGPDRPEALAAVGGTGVDPADIQIAGLVAGVGGLAVVVIVSALAGTAPPAGVVAGLIVAGVALPRVWIGSRVAAHRAEVARELPKVAGLLTLGAESGLGLLESVRLASGLSPGPVGRALERALGEIDAGRETTAALRAVAGRIGGREGKSFVGAVVQGLELGAPVARVLRVQAESLLTRRRQQLEAKIAGLSLRLTIVTIVLFVPALFVLTVLPNLMSFLQGQW